MSGDGTIDEGEERPKRRFFLRKRIVIAAGGILLLLGGTGAAALYVGTDTLLGKSGETLGGLDCKDVARVAIKRNDNQIWLHKFIQTEPTDGPTRIKTAIRVATGMAEKLRADMIHIVVLDQKGPTKRSDFRDMAFGAEVFYVRNVGSVPGYDATFTARYAVGSAAENGNFYGKRRSLTSEQVVTLAQQMEERNDCIPSDEEKAKMDAAEKAKESHKPKEADKKPEHAAPAHGEVKAVPAPDPALAAEDRLNAELGIVEPPPVDVAKAEPDHGKDVDKGFLDSMLSMVGLGAKDAEADSAAAHPAAHAEEGLSGHPAPAAGDSHNDPADPAAEHAPAETDHGESKDALPPSAVDLKIPEKPDSTPSMFGKIKAMIGLGAEEPPVAEDHGAEASLQHPSAEGSEQDEVSDAAASSHDQPAMMELHGTDAEMQPLPEPPAAHKQ